MKSLEALTLLAALAASGSSFAAERDQSEVMRVTINEERCRGKFCALYEIFDENVEIRFAEEATDVLQTYSGMWSTKLSYYRVAVRVSGERAADEARIKNKKYWIYIYTSESERAVGELYSAAPLKNLQLVGSPVGIQHGITSSLRVEVSSRKKGSGSTDPFPGCTGCTFW